jgi:nitrite reductase/ring-hydroxylating ferredoxin subunit
MPDSRFPFSSFPNGWFALAWSDELTKGAVLPVHAFGKELVVFRGESGAVKVLDAFCPHLGTHLGHGGCVNGETIQCPFHAWRFDGQGACVEIPNATKIPPQAKLGAWTVREQLGAILVHFDHEGRPPQSELPRAEELEGGAWTAPVHYGWTIKTHVQEICENLADVAHFGHLHRLPDAREIEATFGDDCYRMILAADGTTMDMRLYGLSAELSRIELFGDQYFAMKLATPIDEERVHLRVASCTKIKDGESKEDAEQRSQTFKELTAGALLQDVPLWENKRYNQHPLLTSQDGPIGPFRRYAKRFYPAQAQGA